MKLLLGGIMHETHTFAAEPTPVDAFAIHRGDEIWSFQGANHSVGGVIDQCRDSGIDLAPTLFAHASPSAAPDRATFDKLVDELVSRMADAMPADGVVLTLHGAMVADGFFDAEAEIVRRVREDLGDLVPIAITLDLHANIGRKMVDLATLVVTYDTYPHVDASTRAREAVALLHRTVEGEINPSMALVKPPLLPVPQGMYSASPPMSLLYERAHAMEETGEALTVTVAGGFPYADVPDAGMSFLIVTDQDPEGAERLAGELAQRAWGLRASFQVQNVPPEEAVRRAITFPDGPVVLVDVGDNIGGGTPGDGTVLLRELLSQGASNATVFIADPDAVESAVNSGPGGTFRAAVGGKTDHLHGSPVDVSGTVRLISDGAFVYDGPENAGLPASMGTTAVVRDGGVNIVLTSIKMAPGDLQQLKSVGIDPSQQKIIVAKAAVRWRGGYESVVKHAINVDTPGLGSVDLTRFEFRNVRRPIYPLDSDVTWTLPV